jgi:hypothetical protein
VCSKTVSTAAVINHQSVPPYFALNRPSGARRSAVVPLRVRYTDVLRPHVGTYSAQLLAPPLNHRVEVACAVPTPPKRYLRVNPP